MAKGTCKVPLVPLCDKPVFCRGWCSAHYSRWQRHGDPLYQERQSPLAPDATEKWCPRCEAHRPVTEFKQRKGRKASRASLAGYCNPCMAAYDVGYRADETGAENKSRAADRYSKGPRHDFDLRKRYGIGVVEYEMLIERQGGVCAICEAVTPHKSGDPDRRWNVDHCHETGQVRGLLCGACNLGLGKFGDNPKRLRAAATYVEQHLQQRLIL